MQDLKLTVIAVFFLVLIGVLPFPFLPETLNVAPVDTGSLSPSGGGLVGQYWGNTFFGSSMSSCDNRAQPIIPPQSLPNKVQVDANITTGFSWHPFDYVQFSVKWTGNITIATSGTYGFQLVSDDGSWLYINSTLIIDHGGLHATTDPPGQRSLFLSQGFQRIEVDFYETCGNPSGINFSWMPPGTTSFVIVPQSMLTPQTDYGLSASSPVVNTGESATSTIAVTSLNGFTGTVSLTDTIPSGLNCGPITPSSITGSGTAALSCTSSVAVAGSFSVRIDSTSGLLSHSGGSVFAFVDFISASPLILTSIPVYGCVGVFRIKLNSPDHPGLFVSVGTVPGPFGGANGVYAGSSAGFVQLDNAGNATMNVYVWGDNHLITMGQMYQVVISHTAPPAILPRQVTVQASFTFSGNGASNIQCSQGGGGGLLQR